MFEKWNPAQSIMGLLALTLVLAVAIIYAQGNTPPDSLLAMVGVVLGYYFKRNADNDAIATSERVLRTQVIE